MRCECYECTSMFDPERMMQCEVCEEHFCPSCWEDHDCMCETEPSSLRNYTGRPG